MGLEAQELDHMRKLFVGGLHPTTTTEALERHFAQFGKVVEAKVVKDQNGKTRGFGFIKYENSQMVDTAQNARPHEIDGKSVESKRLVPRSDINKPEARVTVKKLFVGGVKNEHDENSLRQYFEQFGNIVNFNIATDTNTGRRKGYAFVEYDDYDCVDKAIIQKFHILNGIPLDVKKAISKQMAEQMGRNNGPNNMGSPNGGNYNGQPNAMQQHNWSTPSGYGGQDSWSGNNMMSSPPNNWNGQNHNAGYGGSQSSSYGGQNNGNFASQPQNRRNFQNNRMNPYPNKKTQGFNNNQNNTSPVAGMNRNI